MKQVEKIVLINTEPKPMNIIEELESRQTAWRPRELVALLQLGRRTVYDAIESGALPAFHFGGAIRISPSDALAWAKSRQTGLKRAA